MNDAGNARPPAPTGQLSYAVWSGGQGRGHSYLNFCMLERTIGKGCHIT